MTNAVVAEYGETITVARTTPGTISASTGRWVAGTTSTLELVAAVVPLSPVELATFIADAGQESRDGIVVYSDDELKASDEATKQAPDVITRSGRQYVVRSVSYRGQISDLAHYRTVALLKDS